MMKTMNTQHWKEMEYMRKIQTDIQGINISTDNIHKVNECEEKISGIEDRIVVIEHE